MISAIKAKTAQEVTCTSELKRSSDTIKSPVQEGTSHPKTIEKKTKYFKHLEKLNKHKYLFKLQKNQPFLLKKTKPHKMLIADYPDFNVLLGQ